MNIRTERIGIIVAMICIIMLNILVWWAVVKTVSLEQNNDTDAVTETTACVTTTTEEETTTCSTTTTTTSSTVTTTSTTSYTTETQTQTTTSEVTTETSRQTTTEETTNTYTITTTCEVVETTTTEQSQMTYLGNFTGMYYKGETYPCNGGSGRMLVSCYEKIDSYKGSVASKFIYYNYDYNMNGKTMVYIEFEKYPQLNGWYSVDDCNEDQNVVDFYFADYSTCPWQTAGVTPVSVWICV